MSTAIEARRQHMAATEPAEKTVAAGKTDSMASSTPKASFDSQGMAVASFDGSFAPLVRPRERRPVPWYRDREYFLGGWLTPSIWKAAIVEFVATTCLVYVSGQIAATLMSYKTAQVGAYIGLSNVVLISIFIYATSPASGGHLNPMITFFRGGVWGVSAGESVLYLCGQTLGAALAGGILLGVWGKERAIANQGGGCFVDFSVLTTGQTFLNEIIASFALLYLAYGVGLDPRQAVFFGPRLGPLLVGGSLGIVSFATSGMAPGYGGAQMNPARCFAFGIARGDMSDQWIWWFGPAIASVMLSVFYNAIPPHHAELETTTSRRGQAEQHRAGVSESAV